MPYHNKHILSFLLTTQCNMACKYCYGARKIAEEKLDMNFAKCAIDDYVKTNKVSGIRFFADGEPTIEMGRIKEITAYAKTYCPDLHCEIQTNGYFNQDTAEWLAYNMDEVWISMDLLPRFHDENRLNRGGQPTSAKIEGNLRYFKGLADKKAMVGVRSTITPHNVDAQKEGIDYLAALDIKHIWVDPIFQPVFDKEEKTYEPLNIMHFARTFVEARNYAKSKGVFYESNLTTNFDGKTCYACRACLPMPHLTVDGYVSACEMCTRGANPGHMGVFIYGKYDAKGNKIIYDRKKIAHLQSRKLENMPDCQDCIAREHCAGFCLGETQNEKGDLFKIKEVVCEPLRYIYSRIGDDYESYGGEFTYKHP